MRKAVAIACLSVSLLFTGCAKVSPAPNEQEVEFLKDQYWGGSRFEQGMLLGFEANALDAYRDALTYLSEKYSDRGFEISSAKINKYTTGTNTFYIKDTSTKKVVKDGTCSVIVETSKDSETITDNYWGYVIKSKYEAALLPVLKQTDPRIHAVDVTFNTFLGKDEKPTVKQLIAGNFPVEINLVVYMNDSTTKKQYKTTESKINTYMKNHKLSGRCTLYAFSSDDDLKKALKSGNHESAIYSDFFSNDSNVNRSVD